MAIMTSLINKMSHTSYKACITPCHAVNHQYITLNKKDGWLDEGTELRLVTPTLLQGTLHVRQRVPHKLANTLSFLLYVIPSGTHLQQQIRNSI